MRADRDSEYVEFVTARLPTWRRLAWMLCGDQHRADDLVQQTITTLYVRWARMEKVSNPDQYVRTMLVNAFMDEKRRPWSRVRLFRNAPDGAETDGPDIEEREHVRNALSAVPPRQRAVLVLRFLCDLSVTEVASILNCSPGTVKSQTARGLAALRRLLDERSSVIDQAVPATPRQ